MVEDGEGGGGGRSEGGGDVGGGAVDEVQQQCRPTQQSRCPLSRTRCGQRLSPNEHARQSDLGLAAVVRVGVERAKRPAWRSAGKLLCAVWPLE